MLILPTPNEDVSNKVTNQSYKPDRTAELKPSNTIFRECHIDDCNVKQKSGFHSIFSWFSRKQKGSNSNKLSKTSSTVSLNSSSNTLKFVPISHSCSADSPSGWKKQMKVNALQLKDSNIETSSEVRRNSNASLQSSASHMSATSSIQRSKKRRAPDPPCVPKKTADSSAMYHEGKQENLSKRQALIPQISILERVDEFPKEQVRPISSLSSASSFSMSASSTLKSSFPSESASSSTVSLFDKLVGAPYVKNNASLSPKPWFKRKNFSNSLKRKPTPPTDDKIYDMWMPNMQFANRNLTLNSSKGSIDSLIQNRRCSVLSNISDLDRAAQEIVQADRRQKEDKVKGIQPSPHFLQQQDINPKEKINFSQCDNLTYDNVTCKANTEICQERTLRPELNQGMSTSFNLLGNSENVAFSKLNETQPVYSLKRSKDVPVNPPAISFQNSIMDPELFYRLAKNTTVSSNTTKFKSGDIPNHDKVWKPTKTDTDKTSKNFGLRMNNLFTPDISTIQEGSESISSSVTPLEDVEKDFQALAASVLDNYSDSFSISSDYCREFKINLDGEVPYENFSVKKSKGNINTMLSNYDISDTPKSFNDVIKCKEKENFINWQKVKRGTDESVLEKEVSNEERNQKWICDSCTLINKPWRLQCEVCNCIRPPRPQRTNKFVLDENTSNSIDVYGASAYCEEADYVPSVRNENSHESKTAKELFAINLEAELQKYFDDPYKNDPKTFSNVQPTSVRKVMKKEPDGYVDISEIRQVRIKKFSYDVDNEIYINHDTISDIDKISSALKEHSKAEFKHKVEEFESILINGNKTAEVKSKGEKNSGAVRSAVSLINQWGQNKTEDKSLPIKVNKHNIQTTKKGSFDAFSDSTSDSSTLSDVRSNGVIKWDLDIMSTVNKFDELAAIAEVEQLSRVNPKPNRIRKRIKPPLFQQSFPSFQTADSPQSLIYKNSYIGNGLNAKPETKVNLRVNAGHQNNFRYDPNNKTNVFRKNIRDRDHCDVQQIHYSEITPKYSSDSKYLEKKGVDSGIISENSTDSTDDNVQRRSLSIGPNTFELMSSKEFCCISTHHSERPSPTFELDNDLPTKFSILSSDNTESNSDMDREENNTYYQSDQQNENNDVINTSQKLIENDRINQQLKLLEKAIAENRHKDAAGLAHDLAQMQLTKSSNLTSKPKEILRNEKLNNNTNKQQVSESFTASGALLTLSNPGPPKYMAADTGNKSLSVINRRHVKSAIVEGTVEANLVDETFVVEMYIEDRATHQGPIPLTVKPSMTVRELIKMVQRDYGFPVEVQRWILGRRLADDEDQTLATYRVTDANCPVFLYLVAPETAIRPEATRDIEKPMRSTETKQNLSNNTGNDSKLKKKSKFKKKFINIDSNNTDGKTDPVTGPFDTNDQLFSSPKTKRDHNVKLRKKCQPSVGLMATTQQNVSDSGSWRCSECTLINHNNRPGCEACAAARPDDKGKVALKDVALNHQSCISNAEPFECAVCLMQFQSKEGVVLRECLHMFCRDCLRQSIIHSEMADVKCPFRNDQYFCDFSLQEREIKDLITEDEYLKHHEKSIREAAGTMSNVFYCKTPSCKGFCEFEDNVNLFACNVCRKLNCITCQAQHGDLTCKEYQDDLATKQDEEALKTKQFFDDIIRRGNGIACPKCSVMLVRKWGCDWMRCPMCRSEICWVTRGLRWGPKGPGDTSGGCKCGINGVKCHPKCTYCH